ncbi:MAG TPA: hypothetical protein CFH79_07010 [Sulfurospirillum sp. UBA11407]|jgi:hypothetical protein|nr:MAG TPA: hypothetical protein CFH79_07010 [Sulfurospirillum sp. UBA11407]DAB34504.1 MAG TPA: hypothetical protein CFH82_04910 [Sulfurospirillum sp. UBA12182]
MFTIELKEFKPLTSHQIGIKIKDMVKSQLEQNDDLVILNFDGVDVCTDSFMQQLTTILSHEITFDTFRKRIKFTNLNDFLKDLVKSKLFSASKQVA